MKNNDMENKDVLLQRMRKKARLIPIVGVTVGLCIMLSVLLGTPIPPLITLILVVATALFIVFQLVQIFRLATVAKRLPNQAGASPETD